MKNSINYEWSCEYVDTNGDIQDSDFSNQKAEVWPPRLLDFHSKCIPRLCLIRYSGNEEQGEQERGYAYFGDDLFSSGHIIPQQYRKQLK